MALPTVDSFDHDEAAPVANEKTLSMLATMSGILVAEACWTADADGVFAAGNIVAGMAAEVAVGLREG